MSDRTRVDTNAVPWENGLSVIAAMAPEFRANLGPEDQLETLYVKYNQKTLRIDDATSRRIDLIRIDAGYRDLTNAYHDSVEECFVLEGELDLDGEGHFVAGDYFWRPPGFVHAADTSDGFTALLSLQGDDPTEGSGPASRRIRPDEEAGLNGLFPEDAHRAMGPRGWVRNLPSSLVAWQPGPVYARGEGVCADLDLDRVDVKPLSKNPWTGAQSALLKLQPGYQQIGDGRSSAAWEFFVTDGSCSIGEENYAPGVYGYIPANSVQPPLRSSEGATLFVKLDGWLERLPV